MTAFAELRRRVQEEMARRMPEHIRRLGWSRAEIAAHQRDRLRALVQHAMERSPFHARRLRGVDARRLELEDLPRLPVMTKTELMASFDEAATSPAVTRAGAEAALAATGVEPVPFAGEHVAMATGGSSGRRGVFVLDVDALCDFFCCLQRGLLARGAGGVTIAMVAAASAVHATGFAAALTGEGDSPVRFVSVPVTLPIDWMVARLNALQTTLLFGYPSVLVRLAAEARAGRLRIAPRTVTSLGEMLSPAQRAQLEAAFEVAVNDSFGSTEGLVGSAPGAPPFTFNSDCCIVELVDADGRPVPPGTPSAHVLVTNLANRVQPLIRYVLGDRFVREADVAEHGHLRATVDGRADEPLRYAEVEVHPHVVRAVLLRAPAIVDYQVRQTAGGIDVALVTEADVDVGRVATALGEALARAGLERPEVGVRCVAALERQADSGKVSRFIAMRS